MDEELSLSLNLLVINDRIFRMKGENLLHLVLLRNNFRFWVREFFFFFIAIKYNASNKLKFSRQGV